MITILSYRIDPSKRKISVIISAIIFGLLYSVLLENSMYEEFRDRVDSSFQPDKVYYYDTVPTTITCNTGLEDGASITFYYNDGTLAKHTDASNNTYTCTKKITKKYRYGYSQDYSQANSNAYANANTSSYPAAYEEIISYTIKPVKLDPSFNCPEPLDYDHEKEYCVLPSDPLAYYNSSLPKKYKCPHALGHIVYNYGDRSQNYTCDPSGSKQLVPNGKKDCPPKLRRRKGLCR